MTLTGPGVVLGPTYLGPVDGEAGRLVVEGDDLEIIPLLDLLLVLGDCDLVEGGREGDVRLEETLGDRLGDRLGVLILEELLGVVRLGAGLLDVILLGDLLGVVRLGVLLDGVGADLLGDRETDLEELLDGAEEDLLEDEDLEDGLATGCAAAAGELLTIGFDTAGLGAAFTMGLCAEDDGVDFTIDLLAVDLGVAIVVGFESCGGVFAVGREAAGLGVGLETGFGADLTTGLGAGLETGFGVLLTVGFGVGLETGFGAGLGATLGAGLGAGAALGAGLGAGATLGAGLGAGLGTAFGAAFGWRDVGFSFDSFAKAGAMQVVIATASVMRSTFASCCNLMIAMIGLLSRFSGFFIAGQLYSVPSSIYRRRRNRGR